MLIIYTFNVYKQLNYNKDSVGSLKNLFHHLSQQTNVICRYFIRNIDINDCMVYAQAVDKMIYIAYVN